MEYHRIRNIALSNGDEEPRIPECIGKSIFDIATNLSNKHNYRNYPFLEDMIGDGYMNCIMYGVKNYNPDKVTDPEKPKSKNSQSVLAYFTQIITWAFWRRIAKEKKELYGKFKMIQNSNIMNLTSENDGMIYADEIKNGFGSEIYINEFIGEYENVENEKKSRRELKKREKARASSPNDRKLNRTNEKVKHE